MQVLRYRLAHTSFTQEQYQAVVLEAITTFNQAYQPYSKYKVGCAILCDDGFIAKGCNVETANYDGSHAEENAIGAMVAAGRRHPVLCVCVAGLEGSGDCKIVSSCGKCRQILYEFSSLSGTGLWLAAGRLSSGEPSFVKLSDLLPDPFGPADIGVDLEKYRR